MAFDLRRLLGMEVPQHHQVMAQALPVGQALAQGAVMHGQRPTNMHDLQPGIEGEGVNPIQMQQYGPETGYATGIQGLQNPGFTPAQGGQLNYQQAPQPASFRPIQQDPYSKFRRISF